MSVLGGIGYAIYNFFYGRDRAEISLLLLTFLPYYVLFGSRASAAWYVPFLFPALALLAAYGYINLNNFLGPRYAEVTVIAMVVVGSFPLLRAIAFDLQFVNDARDLTAAWVDQHVPDHASVSVGPRGPKIPEDEYHLFERPMDRRYHDFVDLLSKNLERHTLYQTLRRSIRNLERHFVEALGLPMRPQPYQAWFDGRREQPQTVAANQEQWLREKPDYIVLVDYLEQARISTLRDGNSGYQIVARIDYENSFKFDVSFPFVNPDVYVFRRASPRR